MLEPQPHEPKVPLPTEQPTIIERTGGDEGAEGIGTTAHGGPGGSLLLSRFADYELLGEIGR